MKKLAMAVALAATLGTVNASCASSFSGFYAGLQAGLASTSGQFTNVDAAGATESKINIGEKSFVGGLFAGYGMGVGSCAYVGGELYANFDSLNKNFYQNGAGTTKFKVAHKNAFGAKVRLGYTVSQQAMVFLGLGGEYGKTRISETAPAFSAKKQKSSFSFAPSVGMEMFLSKNLFLRGEYTYVTGLKAKITANTATGATADKVNLNQQRFMLGLGYKF